MNLDSNVLQVPIEDIIPNRFQPRLSFDDKALQELSSSIKQHGIIQPLVLRKLGDKYEIIAGERRYKAATMAGLTSVPAVIADIDDNTSAEVALVENVQRKDLTAIEEAKSYKNILDKGYMTQDELAKKMGLSQSAVANKLRLLNLAEEVQDALLNEKISERHARALLAIESHEEQRNWLKRILEERLTVRQLDMEIKKTLVKNEPEIEVPTMNIEPNIEEIKANATDINNESTQEIIDAPTNDVIKPLPNKFFNFLEDEAVNMNTETIETPKIEITTDIEPVEPIFESLEIENPVAVEEIETLDDDFNIFTPEVSQNSKEEIMQEPVNIEMIPLVEDDNYIDPMTLVETLDPEYEEKQKEEEGLDLKTAINTIRSCVDALNTKGFAVEIEEIDLEKIYQINLKVNKE